MFLTSMDDKWSQDKINTAYGKLSSCIATTKQRETVQPFYNISFTGDLASFNAQCPSGSGLGGSGLGGSCLEPVRPQTLWATNLCDNTVIPVGAVCANGNIFINSSCLKTTQPTTLSFCSETRWVQWSGLETCEDFYNVSDKGTCATYENCVWVGSNRQYNCRTEVSKLCQSVWTDTVMGLSSALRTCCCYVDVNAINECLHACAECNGCWELPYPCYKCCTFCNVSYKVICSQFLIYCTPDGCFAPNEEVKCIVSHNPATMDCNYEAAIPYCYIGWSQLPYCYGGEKCEKCECIRCLIVPESPLGVVCRVIDVYTAKIGSETETHPLYVINQNIPTSIGGK